jgi:LuxR family transcriptional regulator, maltose regulon positive regulatory protein
LPLPKVLRTKITPPPKSARTLLRPRISQVLQESLNYRLTILQAGAGYGKSTALSVLAEEIQPLFWYQVTQEDTDPLVFLLHLCHATQRALTELSGLPVAFLETWDGTRGPLPSAGVVDQYINALNEQLDQPALLVVDDVHLVSPAAEIAHILDRLIGLAPYNLHILLAGRPSIQLPNLARWKSRGNVMIVDQSVLSFNRDEIADLFTQQYGYELTVEEVDLLASNTEGWAIALQLIWQSLRSGASTSIENSFIRKGGSLESLFDILAREVFERQPPDVQEFLLVSATLREMTAEACDALRTSPVTNEPMAGKSSLKLAYSDSNAMLAYLRRQELFIVDQGDGSLRYHHIFHDFLQQQATELQRQAWHRRAANYFQARQDVDSSIYHLLQAADYQIAGKILEDYGGKLLAAGRLDTLASDLDAMPPETLHQYPALMFYMGDLARLHSRFQEALGWYQQSENVWRERGQQDGVARALRGQARVYLDTVNPSQAEELLQKSLRLSDGVEGRESQARLYELLAENKLNAGHAEEAERLRQKAEALRTEWPSDSQLLFRVWLRTGRLEEARRGLEARAEAERHEPVLTPRAHRETLLLLSLIYAFQGRAEEAYQAALEGTRRGDQLQSPYVTAVGHMRQGHALMLLPEPGRYAQARQQFKETIEISRVLAVQRLLVETYWGLCRVAGYQGDLAQAMQVASDGIEIATQVGDEWIASLLRLAIGASLSLAARYEPAEEWLERADLGFFECSDPFGRCAARLWLSLGWYSQKRTASLSQTLPKLLTECRERGYDFLLTRPTLLGPPDERTIIPLLILARNRGWEAAYITRLLGIHGLASIEFHPGYQLQVTTLGSFQTRRGTETVPANGWRREKARQLFELLLTYRDAPLDRDQIIEYLWPQMDPGIAQRNFKVALNTLYQVLEPKREPGSESAYVLREGTIYNLRPNADLWLDSQNFKDLIQEAKPLLEHDPQAAISKMEAALKLYQGEYLPEARYETWTAAEREHLAVSFLFTADHLSEYYLQCGRLEETLEICQRILSYDNCWERAYRHLMVAYDCLGDHGQAARTYQRCVQTLREELDVNPAPETEAMYQKLIQNL